MGNSAESIPDALHIDGTKWPEKVTEADISHEAPLENGTKLILQRHGKYERSLEAENAGSIIEEATKSLEEQGYNLFSDILKSLPEEDRHNIDMLFVASNTRYGVNADLGQRSMETAEHMMRGVQRALEENNLSLNQILNKNSNYHTHIQEEDPEGSVRPVEGIVEPQIFGDDAKLAKFISSKVGAPIGSVPFWQAYESDRFKEEREAAGIEGPHEIADRMQHFVEVLARYARRYHAHTTNSGKRLIILASTHYDTISPFVKDYVLQMTKEESDAAFVGVDYAGGISIEIDPQAGELTGKVSVNGKDYRIELAGKSKDTTSLQDN